MAVNVVFCGTTYSIPAPGDSNAWGAALNAYLQALAVQPYLPSQSANAAASGVLRLAAADTVAWRNAANSADAALAKGAQDQLTWKGADVTDHPRAIYNTAAGQVVAGGPSIINFGTSELDTAAAVTVGAAWKFTVPVGKGGVYSLQAQVTTVSGSGAGALILYKNGVQVRNIATMASLATAQGYGGQTLLSLAPGDFVDFRLSGTATLTTSALANFCCLTRLPG